MCIFSREVDSVSSTKIFARDAGANRQFLAYGMTYEAAEGLAMILPLPVVGGGEDPVQFIDLSGYPTFFADMDGGFATAKSYERSLSRSKSLGPLEVVQVGSFEASYVPSRGDFWRLDPRFQLPASVWDQMPQYARYGFAVFKLRPGEVKVHPMAFSFPRGASSSLFFPTVHVHDGAVHEDANFDHQLYCQVPQGYNLSGWERSPSPAGTFVDVRRALGLVSGSTHCFRKTLVGTFPNTDVTVQIQ